MTDNSTAQKILDYIMSHGGDFGEVYSEDSFYTTLVMSGESLEQSGISREQGTGIRIFKGDTCIYLYENGYDEASLFRLLKDNTYKFKDIANSPERLKSSEKIDEKRKGEGSACLEKNSYLNSISGLKSNVPLAEKAMLLKRCNAAGTSADEHIFKVRTKYTDMEQNIYIANTEGFSDCDRRLKTRLHITAFAKDGDEIKTAYVGPGAMSDFEYYETIDPEEWAKRAAVSAVSMLGAKACPTGRMPVIITNGFGGLFFHEACGHSLEASAIADGASEFSGKLGQKVASEKVSLTDDGSLLGEWGSYRIDDEGVPSRKNILIENGILKGYLTDRWNGRKLGLSPTGSGRRQNYRFAPTSRMTNTYISPGTDSLEAMTASVERGLYVKSINAGSVNPATGEFNFNTNETFLIENGKITCPVRNATLIGTGGDILRRVEMVGNDFDLRQGFCYAASGKLYIGAGQPTVKISEMTVGGDKL